MIGKSKYIKTVFYSCVNIFIRFSVCVTAMICMCIDTICLRLTRYIYVDIVSIYMYIHIYVLLLGKNRVSRKVRDREKISSINVEKNSFYKCRIFSSTFVEFYKRRVLHL